MKRSKVYAAALALAVACSLPASAKTDAPVSCDGKDTASCRYIIEATEAFTRMLVTSDPAPLRRHLDPRSLWVSTRGEKRSGAQLIAAVAGDTKRAAATLDRADVRFFGNVAIVTWEESWTAPGRPVPAGRIAGVDTWVRRNGQWKLVATVESQPLPQAAANGLSPPTAALPDQ